MVREGGVLRWYKQVSGGVLGVQMEKSMGWRSGVCYDDVFLRCGRWGGVVLMSKMPRLLRESLRWYNYRGALYCYLFRFRY